MLGEAPDPGITAFDWVLAAMCAQRNLFRIYGDRGTCPVGRRGVEHLALVAECDPMDAIFITVEHTVDPAPRDTDQWPLFVRMADRLGHWGAIYNVRGRHLLEPSERVKLWPNGRPGQGRGTW